MGCKEDLENYLTEHHVPFERQQHPVAYTAQEVASSEHVPGELVAKVVMVMADDRLVMAVLPAPYRLDLAKTKTLLGAEDVRLAREDEFAPVFPDCEVGAMPPFGNLYGLPVWVDTALAEDETIICQAGTHTDTVSLTYEDFERLVQPTVAELHLAPGTTLDFARPDYEKELHGACPRGHFALVEQGYGDRRWVSCGICDYTLDLAPEYEEEV